MRALDKDKGGGVSVEELVVWWRGRVVREHLDAHAASDNTADVDSASAADVVRPDPSLSSAERLQQLRTWAEDSGPTSVRVLSFVAGLGLCVCAAITAVIADIFVRFDLQKIIVDSLLLLGGLLVVILEGPTHAHVARCLCPTSI